MAASQTIRVLDHSGFDVADFSRRWRLARYSAIGASLGERAPNGWSELSEPEAVSIVPPESAANLLRHVFDKSRRLGLGTVRHFGLVWELQDLRDVLALGDSDCVRGQWREHPGALALERSGCSGVRAAGKIYCDYWREALDGLVSGACEDERLARHASQGHGDEVCVDILYTTGSAAMRWQPLNDEVTGALSPTLERMASSGFRVGLKGIAEGTLYYTLESATGAVCGTGGKLARETFERAVRSRCSGLEPRDITPLAVYGSAE